MAVNRVLKSAEKEILQGNARFISEASWAITNFASYWGDNNKQAALALANQAGIDVWHKNFIFSKNILTSGFQDSNVGKTFTVLAKGMNLQDNALPFDAELVIDYMIANSKFEELATPYVELKTETVIF